MKAHIGMDSKEKLIHTVKASAANVADSLALPHLLHGKETRVYGDQAYRGQADVIRRRAPRAKDFTNQRYRYNGQVDETERRKNRIKSKIRSRVEHAFWGSKVCLDFPRFGIAVWRRICTD
jgi:IS5 family transposase